MVPSYKSSRHQSTSPLVPALTNVTLEARADSDEKHAQDIGASA